MGVTIWRFIALVLAALSLTAESAHVLELPQKLRYDAQMYTAVNTTLYQYFAIVGGAYQVAAIFAVFVLAWVVRNRRPAFQWTLVSALLLLLAFGVWLAVVSPVNSTISQALRTAPASVPALWMQLRARWEYGHAAGFVIQLLGFCSLVISVLVDTRPQSSR